MKYKLVFCAALTTLICSTGWAQQKQDLAEKFYYHVHYGKSRVANVNLFTGCTNTKTKPAAMMAISKGLAEQIHSFSIRFDSMLKPRQTTPLLGITSITEEGRTRVYRSRFKGQKTSKINVTSRFKGKFKRQNIDLPYPAHDMLSWILDLRTKSSFAPKTQYTYYVWDGWKLFRLNATVKKAERMITPSGNYKAHRIELKRTRLHHDGDKKLTAKKKTENLGIIWLSTDAQKMPVAINFYAAVGNANIRLLKHTKKTCQVKPPADKAP